MATTTKKSVPLSVKAPDPIAPKFPQPKPAPKPVVAENNDGEEALNVEADVTAQDEYDFSGRSATQVEDDVKELFKGTAVNHEVEIKEGSDIVDKFVDGFSLLRHQIQARQWMEERETGGSRGGILADDMGLVILPAVVLEVELFPVWAKRFRRSSASSRGNPTGATALEVSSHRLCASLFISLHPQT